MPIRARPEAGWWSGLSLSVGFAICMVPLATFDLFGPPRVRRGDADVRFDTRKALALLALLAVTGRESSREALAGLLWPDLERSRARATLRRTLSVASAVGPALVVHADRVSLDAAAVDCDVVEFRRLAASTRSASFARSPASAWLSWAAFT